MRERPIRLSAHEVRALLAGTKTQTRRAFSERTMKMMRDAAALGEVSHFMAEGRLEKHDLAYIKQFSPYGQPGEQLWVRESWAVGNIYDSVPPSKICDWLSPGTKHEKAPCGVAYPASGGCVGLKARPSIHMPRWASRITLEITGVRVERLQDISEADAWAEGLETAEGELDEDAIFAMARGMPGRTFEAAVPSFAVLWESINGAGSWDANPWVWVVEFHRLTSEGCGHAQ